ncbi:DUF3822 family protein [Cytophaga sp. FL35]|uniref:DUF3822 family protein n=1 Tax=Cytophaga sp. FL35 TaxID=1904456 RepID=UPI0016535A0A|nr:DUF3822 family protein [Cytophaga sp. FL35]MBC7000080.1 DUF3822 family protein [Cytophaga sp. FL35]
MTKKESNNITANHTVEEFKKLSIQVSLNGLSFCVFDSVSNKIIKTQNQVFEQTLNPYQLLKELKQMLNKYQLTTQKFTEVVVVHRNQLFGLVPKPLFDENELANYLKFNTKILANDHLAFDEIDSHDMVNVYVPFVNINNYIYELYGEFTYKHNGTVMAESLLKGQSKAINPICYVYVLENQMDVTILDQKQLVLFNSFTFHTKEDFLYYLLFTLEQLKLSTETIPLKLFGAVEEDDELYKLCYIYVKNISIFVPEFGPHTYLNNQEDTIDFTVINAL